LPPDHARQIKDLLRLPDEAIEPMYAALERWNVSPDVAANLAGLLTDAEIQNEIRRTATDRVTVCDVIGYVRRQAPFAASRPMLLITNHWPSRVRSVEVPTVIASLPSSPSF
jgi:hypothetical protein